MERALSLNPALFEAEKNSAQGLATVRFIDLTEQLCVGDVCPVTQKGVAMYRDDNHLTGSFAGSLRQPLETELLLSLPPSM